MNVGIHQPNFLPWIGYFYKIFKSDVFVFLDNVQYEKNSYSDRNIIKTPQGQLYLKIPVTLHGINTNYNEVLIKNELGWRDKHLKSIIMNYKKSAYFDEIYTDLEKNYNSLFADLSSYNINMIIWICDKLGIHRKFVLASTLDIAGTSTERLVNIVKACKGDCYISGNGAKKYQTESLFEENNISLEYLNITPPYYRQLWGDFIPNLSILDILFNCGYKSTADIIADLGLNIEE